MVHLFKLLLMIVYRKKSIQWRKWDLNWHSIPFPKAFENFIYTNIYTKVVYNRYLIKQS